MRMTGTRAHRTPKVSRRSVVNTLIGPGLNSLIGSAGDGLPLSIKRNCYLQNFQLMSLGADVAESAAAADEKLVDQIFHKQTTPRARPRQPNGKQKRKCFSAKTFAHGK